MPPDDERQLPEDIFHDALPLDSIARAELLKARCGGSAELRAEVEQLLALADRRPELLLPPGELPVPGRLGRYELQAECGRGGMGVVYEALDTHLHRRVALKVLPAHLALDRQRLDGFRREARTLASINDDRIATLYSLEESDGVHFLTMEFVEGETLASLLRRKRPTQRRALQICRDVALALEVAHAQGIVHRDLKPANIMITQSGAIKVLDFGIARTTGDQRREGAPFPQSDHTTTLGTPAYMSPEQSAGRPVDQRSDLWSWGCILYECLTGRRVIASVDGEVSIEAALARLDLARTLPAPIAALVRACLTVDVERRVGSVREIRRQLENMLEDRPGVARLWGWMALGVVAVAFALALMLRQRSSGEIRLASIEIQDQRTVRAIDPDGEAVWIRQFSDRIASNSYQLDERGAVVPQPQTIVDVADQTVAVVLATFSETANGSLWYLAAQDGSEIWRRPASWTSPVNERGPVNFRWTTLVQWQDQDLPVVATLLRDGVWYSAAVQFLSLTGESLGLYYHPGPLFYCCQLTAEDGSSPILLYGTNSSARFLPRVVPFESPAHCGVVVLLDTDDVGGQAFPYSRELPVERDWPGMPPARERAYLLIPPLDPDQTPAVVSVRARPGGGSSFELEVITLDHRVFGTDSELRPQWCFASTQSPADRLRGQTDPFVPVVYIKRGVEESIEVPLRF